MQTCLTKFFQTSNPNERFEYVFEREKALEERRKKEREETMRRLREEERRKNRELRRLASAKRSERMKEMREAREEALKRKYEGIEVAPGIYLGLIFSVLSSLFLFFHSLSISQILLFILTFFLTTSLEESNSSSHL